MGPRGGPNCSCPPCQRQHSIGSSFRTTDVSSIAEGASDVRSTLSLRIGVVAGVERSEPTDPKPDARAGPLDVHFVS